MPRRAANLKDAWDLSWAELRSAARARGIAVGKSGGLSRTEKAARTEELREALAGWYSWNPELVVPNCLDREELGQESDRLSLSWTESEMTLSDIGDLRKRLTAEHVRLRSLEGGRPWNAPPRCACSRLRGRVGRV